MLDERDANPKVGAAALEHMTGPAHGTKTWLGESTLDLILDLNGNIQVTEAHPGDPPDGTLARLHPAEGSFEIQAPSNQQIWVNGVLISAVRLKNCDMIEFGEEGPLSRFRLFHEDRSQRKTVAEILSDSADYLRVSRQPLVNRVFRAGSGILKRLLRETTILFRVAVAFAIIALAVFAYQQSKLNVQLQQRIDSGAAQLESFSKTLARARSEALTPNDLKALRHEFGNRMISNAERLKALEQRSGASARVIASSKSSVAFIQGAFGFSDTISGRMLRRAVDENGRPLISSKGQPQLTMEGKGPVAEIQFTGTGFAVGTGGTLVTNRHVALPWEGEAIVEAMAGQGLEPKMIKLIVYLPGKTEAVPAKLLKAAKDADLAILRFKDKTGTISGLTLSKTPSVPGDEVIVMGYPTGLRAMLAQSDDAFIKKLQKAKDTGFWSVAARLAKERKIAPLASRGIIGQVTLAKIVYDAETTSGGSGGPVLDVNGSVVAVNTAILPEFGGSNLGVPVAKVHELIKDAGLR